MLAYMERGEAQQAKGSIVCVRVFLMQSFRMIMLFFAKRNSCTWPLFPLCYLALRRTTNCSHSDFLTASRNNRKFPDFKSKVSNTMCQPDFYFTRGLVYCDFSHEVLGKHHLYFRNLASLLWCGRVFKTFKFSTNFPNTGMNFLNSQLLTY